MSMGVHLSNYIFWEVEPGNSLLNFVPAYYNVALPWCCYPASAHRSLPFSSSWHPGRPSPIGSSVGSVPLLPTYETQNQSISNHVKGFIQKMAKLE